MTTADGRPATIYDVAKRAKVSHQTVALYLRGHSGFRTETRERVEQALRDLDYRPNRTARALATRRSDRIGALVYELLEVGPSKTIQGAADRAREAGYLLDLIALDPHDERALGRALDALSSPDYAGILAFAPVDQVLERLEATRFAAPVIAEAEPHENGDPHSISDIGLGLVVDHLVDLGHRRFFYLGGPTEWAASRTRARAYADALARHGLHSAGETAGNWSSVSGYEAIRDASIDPSITALIAGNDQMALGALLALDERGVDVPGELSVTGFDDIPEAGFFRPPLTTVRIDYATQGRQLVDRLLAVVDPEAIPASSAVTAPELVVRASSGPAPA